MSGQSLIDTRRLFYDGNSQGGIIGGALTAVARRPRPRGPRRARDELLDAAARSTDWGTGQQPSELDLPEYSWFMYEAYPNELERQLIFSLIQTLWDRAEANGYAQHMTDDPLPNTPPHEVMLHAGARRPPGRAGGGGGRGAHDRRVRAHAVRRRRAATATATPTTGSRRSRASRSRARRWSSGTSGRSAPRTARRSAPRCRPPRTRRPASRPARTRTSSRAGHRPARDAEVRVPVDRRAGDRRVRVESLLRRYLDRRAKRRWTGDALPPSSTH